MTDVNVSQVHGLCSNLVVTEASSAGESHAILGTLILGEVVDALEGALGGHKSLAPGEVGN